MTNNFRFLVFSTECHKFVLHSEFSLSTLDKIELRDFSKIGTKFFEIVDNLELSLDLKFRLLGITWIEISKKIAIYFFTMIGNKTSEDLKILQRMSDFLNSNDFDRLMVLANQEREIYNQNE